jgi:hypothetical protein
MFDEPDDDEDTRHPDEPRTDWEAWGVDTDDVGRPLDNPEHIGSDEREP